MTCGILDLKGDPDFWGFFSNKHFVNEIKKTKNQGEKP
jgi:hypothetical protein